ncbi:MAG: hypothetical protein NVSMB9_07020 [Isosphaeraceae bacterium]
MDVVAPVIGLIDKTEELLGHSPHPAIVALPIGAWSVSNVCDGLALLTGNERMDDVARVSMAIGLVGASAAVVTGLRDYSHIDRNERSHGIATAHGIGNAVVGSLFVTSYLMRQRDYLQGRPTSVLSRVVALAAGGLTLYTAWLGGVLVEELGVAVRPVIEAEHEHLEKHG